MSWDAARGALKVADVAIAGLELVEHALGGDGPVPMTALVAARAAIKAIREGAGGHRSAQEIMVELEVLHDALKAHDAAADAALVARFGKP